MQDAETTFPPLIDKAYVLTGATASGKSSLGLDWAERVGGEILSLDSIAVYRDMDIGTAKPTADQIARVPHHLINLVDPAEEFSVACYMRAAHQAVNEICSRGKVPIFVGGTPMFLKGILRGFDPGPPADWEFRKSVERDVQEHGVEALRERLRQVDPLAEHRINTNDVRRMIRALEVSRATGVPISHRQIQFEKQVSPDQCNVNALMWPRDQLHARINERVEAMFQAGLVGEVQSLLDRPGGMSRTARQAVGYREVIEHLDGTIDLDTAKEQVAAHTRRLARRQETWFRSFKEIRHIEMSEGCDPEQALQQLQQR
ncbi:IPP transferase [Rubripirellula amarantea]|uniref:tRNA dimethylallyltransferase n=1 Tax=Rubripirellula amarantea TaxID=2527999 RepID=A0A5C5WWL2_9BACT|nr:tRNA (adenosine(37)-N6)-dimethylallyltransferase MiaA [Rubripirellula amarantea]TWT55097.1 IPP transferase [Rubripirellula amarantea]